MLTMGSNVLYLTRRRRISHPAAWIEIVSPPVAKLVTHLVEQRIWGSREACVGEQ